MNHPGPLPLKELHSTGETIVWRDPGGSWVCLPPVYIYEWNHIATGCRICRTCPKKQSAEHAPKSSWQKIRVLQNAEKKKLVLGFLHSINQTGSPQDESDIHSYFIPGQKSSKRKFYFYFFKSAHNSRHDTINSKHNQHQYNKLHFTYLKLRTVWRGVFSFVDHFSTKLKWSNHKYYKSNSLLWHTATCLGASIYIPQTFSYIGQLVMTSSVTYTSHK